MKVSREEPSLKNHWYPSVYMATSSFEFKLATLILHIFPAFIMDHYFKLTGQGMRLMPYYRKLQWYLRTIDIFNKNQYTFDNNNALTVYNR